MPDMNRFPPKLLGETKEVRLKYFMDLTVGHPRLLRAYEDLLQAIRQPFSHTLIFVYGPSGVGKTTLWHRVQKQILEEMLLQLEEDRGRIPFVGIELPAPDSGIFNWKDFYKRFLLAMDEPLVQHKSKQEPPKLDPNGNLYIKTGSRSAVAELRFVAERALIHRRPVAVLIDEAQHLSKMASGRKLQDQLDALKSLSNQTGTIIALLGTYELMVFRNLSAQLSRRSLDIHFKRYQSHSEDDVSAFQSVLMTFQQHLPLQEEPNLLSRWDYFYERSIGCVGVLKEWLARALVEALGDGGIRLTNKHLTRYALSIAQCEKMLSDAREGEMRMTETNDSYRRLRVKLGLEIEANGHNSNKGLNTTGQQNVEAKIPQRQRRVGRRKPKRDKTGRRDHEE